jgi:hypothetical protein
MENMGIAKYCTIQRFPQDPCSMYARAYMRSFTMMFLILEYLKLCTRITACYTEDDKILMPSGRHWDYLDPLSARENKRTSHWQLYPRQIIYKVS